MNVFLSHSTDLKARLHREREELSAANLSTRERVERLTLENTTLNCDNARIKVQFTSLSDLDL